MIWMGLASSTGPLDVAEQGRPLKRCGGQTRGGRRCARWTPPTIAGFAEGGKGHSWGPRATSRSWEVPQQRGDTGMGTSAQSHKELRCAAAPGSLEMTHREEDTSPWVTWF